MKRGKLCGLVVSLPLIASLVLTALAYAAGPNKRPKPDKKKPVRATDIKLVAKSAGVRTEAVRDLNPSLLRWCTPPKAEVFVKIPKGSAERCREALESVPPFKNPG